MFKAVVLIFLVSWTPVQKTLRKIPISNDVNQRVYKYEADLKLVQTSKSICDYLYQKEFVWDWHK